MTLLTSKKLSFYDTYFLRKGGNLKCGQVAKSWRKNKKIVKLYCIDGKRKLVHAGQKGYSDYTKHKDKDRRDNFHARHNCKEAKKGTPKHLACTELWKEGGVLYWLINK